MEISLGRVVYSKAGRDRGKRFVIIGMEDETYVLISDGDLRRVEKPKRKKIKHLEMTETVIVQLKEKLDNGGKVGNSEVRRALAGLDAPEF